MKSTVNAATVLSGIIAAVRAALAYRPAWPESYSISAPGLGLMGDFATIAEAESALRRLPRRAREQATICDADGRCLAR